LKVSDKNKLVPGLRNCDSGGKAQAIDVSQLENLRAVPNGPPGHFGILPRDPSRMQEWISTRGTNPAHEFTHELMNARTHELRRQN
jgi:hypothetical protein